MPDAFGRILDTERYAAISSTEILKDALKTEQDETARLRKQIGIILVIADTGGRRIETAMDACENICNLCVAALPAETVP